MSRYITNEYASRTSATTALLMVNDAVWDCAVAGVGAYSITRIAVSAARPDLFIMQSVSTASMQTMLAFTLDGIFQKNAQYLSPMLATGFCGGLSLAVGTQMAKIILTDDAKFTCISALAFFAMTKGITKICFNRSIYPSLAPLVKLPSALLQAATKTKKYIATTSFIQSATNRVSSLWTRMISPSPTKDTHEKMV